MDDAEVRSQLVRYSDQFRVTAPPVETIRWRLRRRRIRLATVAGAAVANGSTPAANVFYFAF